MLKVVKNDIAYMTLCTFHTLMMWDVIFTAVNIHLIIDLRKMYFNSGAFSIFIQISC